MNKQLWLGVGLLAAALLAHGEEQNPLLGCWQCTSDGEPVPLRFDAKTYVIDGEPLPYQLVQGSIQVSEPDGFSHYPYTLKNGQLTINFEDIPPLVCARVTCTSKKSTGK